MNWASFLVSMVKPMISEFLISLGLAVVSYSGTNEVFNQLTSYVQTNLNGIPVSVAQLMGLAGFGDALGIVLGAFAFRLSMTSMKHISFKTS